MTPGEKAARRELLRHLHTMHGNYTTGHTPPASLETLEAIHQDMHERDYSLPPHDHSDDDEPWYGEFYEPRVILPDGYPDNLRDYFEREA